MSKKVDVNGYWYIKHNPISKEGVFPYLGKSISEDCEPDKVYKVYRSAKTLEQSVDTWDNPPKPFIDDHEMLGEGFTAIDERPVQGIIYNPSCEDGVLYADIAVYSEDLKSEIENGKKELSLGYFCKYRKERGVFNGEVYDFVQEDMVGNHIALVDAGRCGSDVRVFDHKCTMDALTVGDVFEKESSALKKTNENGKITISEEQKKDSVMNYVSLEEIKSVLNDAFAYSDGTVDPKVKLVIELLSAKAKPATLSTDEDEGCKKSEDEDGEESEKEEKKTEDSLKEILKAVKDMADDVKKLISKDEDEESKKDSEDEDEEKKSEDEDEEKKSEDEDEEEKKTEDDDDDEESKTSEDSAVFVLGGCSAIAEDEALKDYLK